MIHVRSSDMDALATLVTLLKPHAVGAKIIHGAGQWAVRYPALYQPSFALVLKGSCWLRVDGEPATLLVAGEFVLCPSMPGFILSSGPKNKPTVTYSGPPDRQVLEMTHGDEDVEPTVSMLGGFFSFDPLNSALLLDLLPRTIRIAATDTAIGSVSAVVSLIQQEVRRQSPGRSFVLSRLSEVMLIESLRSVPPDFAATGLLAGLRDPQLAIALRGIHTQTAHPWTLLTLAEEAAMSRSAFAERFSKVIGVTPLHYLLQWRIAMAKDLLSSGKMTVGEAALAVGYESASGFSTAFSRETGRAPKEFIGISRGME